MCILLLYLRVFQPINNLNQKAMKGSELLCAALGGAIVGAAAALLFAPQKGSDTRESIKEFIKKHYPTIKHDKLDKLADKIESEIGEI